MLIYLCCVQPAADGADVQDALYSVTGSGTVPQVFVNGNFIGGADGMSWLLSFLLSCRGHVAIIYDCQTMLRCVLAILSVLVQPHVESTSPVNSRRSSRRLGCQQAFKQQLAVDMMERYCHDSSPCKRVQPQA